MGYKLIYCVSMHAIIIFLGNDTAILRAYETKNDPGRKICNQITRLSLELFRPLPRYELFHGIVQSEYCSKISAQILTSVRNPIGPSQVLDFQKITYFRDKTELSHSKSTRLRVYDREVRGVPTQQIDGHQKSSMLLDCYPSDVKSVESDTL